MEFNYESLMICYSYISYTFAWHMCTDIWDINSYYWGWRKQGYKLVYFCMWPTSWRIELAFAYATIGSYVCVCVCVHIHRYKYVSMYLYIHIYIYIHICIYSMSPSKGCKSHRLEDTYYHIASLLFSKHLNNYG